MLSKLNTQVLAVLVIAVAVVAVVGLSGNGSSIIHNPNNGNQPQTPLQINNSGVGGQLQAGGIDLQPSKAASQPAVSSDGSGSATPTPTSDTPTPTPSYPPCYPCGAGAGHVCPMSAGYQCGCGGSGTNSDMIACLEE